jgi:hypothetical protein
MREVIKRLKIPIRNEEYPLPWADIRKLDHLLTPFRGTLPATSTVGRMLNSIPSHEERRPNKPRDWSRDGRTFMETARRKPIALQADASSSTVEERRGHSQDKRRIKILKIASQPEDDDDDEILGEELYRGRSREKRGGKMAMAAQETDDENDDDIPREEEVRD